jgi:hypothetical protein
VRTPIVRRSCIFLRSKYAGAKGQQDHAENSVRYRARLRASRESRQFHLVILLYFKSHCGIAIALLFIRVSRKPRRSRPNENGRLLWAESYSKRRFLHCSDQVETGVVNIHGREWHDPWKMIFGPPDRLHLNILQSLLDS